MRHSTCLTARSTEQTHSLNPQKQAALALIRAAARDAVHATTPEQAADIAFGALVRLDGLFREGVCHG